MMTSHPSPSTPHHALRTGRSLAQFLQNTRDRLDMSCENLAVKSGVSLGLIQQLEEGRLNFLSVMNRSRLARVLKITPTEIKQHEIEPPDVLLGNVKLVTVDRNHIAFFNNQKRLALKEMDRNPDGFWPCPDCGAPLDTVTHAREDLEHNPLVAYKIRCTHCLFTLKHEAPMD
jgi:transcriptional regulator with XRE-family HTH domain